jgi:hypothetical protein
VTRGVPLTPAQLAQAAEVYTRTGNYSEAARAIGVDPDTVARRLGDRKRSDLHARALARGVRRARRHLVAGMDVAAALLAKEKTDGAGMEPRDVAAVLNATSRASEALLALEERRDRARQARLTRDKTRAETEFWRRRNNGTLPADNLNVTAVTKVDLADPDAVRARLEELAALAARRAARARRRRCPWRSSRS